MDKETEKSVRREAVSVGAESGLPIRPIVAMITSLPPELLLMVLKRLPVADLFRVRRVCRLLLHYGEDVLAKQKTLVVSVWCNRTAVMTPKVRDLGENTFLLLPDSKSVRLMPSIRSLVLWPSFTNEQDEQELLFFQQTIVQLMGMWSETLVCAEVISGRDHVIDLQFGDMQSLICFIMSHISVTTMNSLMNHAPRLQEIVYLRSHYNSESQSEWSVIEKSDGQENGTEAMDLLSKHQTEWEMMHQTLEPGLSY